MSSGHGLVIGKFYPPHAGHHHLIDVAASQCRRVSVVVMASSVETIPLADRVAWLEETHASMPHVRILGVTDDVAVDYDDPAVWEAHVALMDAALAADTLATGQPASAACVDVVFTSEPYGDELGRRFGARHVAVDPERVRHPVSGRAVRDNVVGNWEHLAPATRAGLALRVVLVGAESTGTTTVARALAECVRSRGGVWNDTGWVEEYGRDYTVGKLDVARVLAARAGRPEPTVEYLVWTPEDFIAIARRQVELEDAAAGIGSPLVVCDTDAFATGVWFTRYVGGRHAGVEAIGDSRRHALYLLTDHEGVPFEQDGWRDGEHLREWMTEEFIARLDETGRPWLMLSGSLESRVRRALDACDSLLATGWSFAEPDRLTS
jgi:HTH-type transcriptional regulator, transcriptional repressor of NAD biosynthesis genes